MSTFDMYDGYVPPDRLSREIASGALPPIHYMMDRDRLTFLRAAAEEFPRIELTIYDTIVDEDDATHAAFMVGQAVRANVELHGTGTPLSEAAQEALAQGFFELREDKVPVVIASSKQDALQEVDISFPDGLFRACRLLEKYAPDLPTRAAA